MAGRLPFQFRLTRTERERIAEKAKTTGFRHLAPYLRYVALDHDLDFDERFRDLHRRVKELHTQLLGETPQPKYRTNPRRKRRGDAP